MNLIVTLFNCHFCTWMHLSKRYTKNFTVVSILLFAISIILTGCRGKEQRTITFAVGGTPNEVEFWETLVKDFEKQNNIKVIILRQPTDSDQRRQGLVVSLKAKKDNPDVFLMDVAWIVQFAASDWLEPLDSYLEIEKINLDVFFGNIINLSDKYKKKLIAFPVYVDGGLLYYRKDLLKQFGYTKPPQTWTQLVEYSIKIQKEVRKTNSNFYGFVWQGAQYEGLVCNLLEFAGSNNGGIVLKDGKILLNLPENTKTVHFMYDLLYKYKISPLNTFTEMKEEETRIFFQQGNALFERNWPYAWALHQSIDSKIKDKVGIATLPHFKNGKSVSTLGGWHIGISKYSDVKSLSWQFVKFITSYETQKKLAMKLGWNPGRKDVYTDSEVLKKLPHFTALKEVFENAQPRPNLTYYTQISEVIQRYINASLAGKITPEDALKTAEQEAQKIVLRYNQK